MNSKLYLLFALFLAPNVGFCDNAQITIGNGAPGMKVATLQDGICHGIYLDAPEAVGVGTWGGLEERNPVILYGRISFDSVRDQIHFSSQQLYPIDRYTAFTSEIRNVSFDDKPETDRIVTIYHLENGRLEISKDAKGALEEAARKYNLEKGARLLGRIDDTIFYWVNFDKTKIYWKKIGSNKAQRIKVPSRVIDIYGVTRGITKQYCFVGFQKKP